MVGVWSWLDGAADVAPLKFEQLGVQNTIAQLVFQGFHGAKTVCRFSGAQTHQKTIKPHL
jgi:hypothetical protein